MVKPRGLYNFSSCCYMPLVGTGHIVGIKQGAVLAERLDN